MKFLKYLFVSVFVLVAIVAILAVVILPMIDFTKYKEQIEAKASAALDTPVKLAAIRELKVFPKPSVLIEGIEIESHLGGKPLLTADKVAVRLNITSLLAMKVGIDEIEVVRPDVNLINTAQGSSWAGKPETSGRAPGSEGDVSAQKGSGNPMEKLTSLGTISIQNANLLYNDKVAGVKHSVENLNVNLGAGDLAKTQIDASVRYNTVPIKVAGALDLRKLKNIPMDMKVDMDGNTVHAQGRLRYLMDEPTFSGTLTAKATTLMTTLNKMLGLELTEMPFEVEGDVLASPVVFKTSQLVLKANNTSAHVVADITNRGNDMITGTATVSVPEFDGMNWGACGAETPKGSTSPASSAPAAKKGERFSKEPLDFSALHNLSLTLNTAMDTVKCGAATIEAVNAKVNIHKGLLKVEPFSFKADDGSFVTEFLLDATQETATGNLKMNINQLNLAKIIDGKVKADIPLNGLVRFDFMGRSAHDLVNSIQGTANIKATEGEVVGVPLGALKLGVETFSGLAFGGGENYELQELSFPFVAENGVFTTESSIVKLSSQALSAKGKIDLPKWRINMDITPEIGSGQGTLMTLPLKLSGPLDKPKIKPDLNSPQGIGAAIGTAVGGPLGTGVGAAVGSMLSGQNKDAQKKKINETTNKVKEELNKAVPKELKGLLGF